MNVAAIDMGTNSARLLITDGQGRELRREMHITRLGQQVDQTGALHPDAIERTLSVLKVYGEALHAHHVARVLATATSAARDASNREAFFTAVEQAIGQRPVLLSGAEEAQYSFQGATAGLPQDVVGPYLVIDIGGGSTEFCLGEARPQEFCSVNMGCVRLSERHLTSDPPTAAAVEACCEDVRKLLVDVRQQVAVERACTAIGLAGTVTSLAHLQLGLRTYAPERTHRSWLKRTDAEAMLQRLQSSTRDERIEVLVEAKRADVIVGGAAVLCTIMRELALDRVLVSEADILDGLAASLRA